MSYRPKRVLVTRSPRQAPELADALRSCGMEPILIPTIELTAPSSYSALDESIANLQSFHWLIFTSANAVEAFQQRFKTSGLWPLDLEPSIAAIGSATARALTAIGLTPSLTPPQAVAESFAAALLPHARQPDGTATRFLLVRAEQARDHMPEALRIIGAEVVVAPAYRTVIPESSMAALRELFATAATYPGAITFTSSSTATNLFELLKTAGLSLPSAILRASIGPITTKTLQELGYSPQIEALEPTVHALAAALKKYFA